MMPSALNLLLSKNTVFTRFFQLHDSKVQQKFFLSSLLHRYHLDLQLLPTFCLMKMWSCWDIWGFVRKNGFFSLGGSYAPPGQLAGVGFLDGFWKLLLYTSNLCNKIKNSPRHWRLWNFAMGSGRGSRVVPQISKIHNFYQSQRKLMKLSNIT